MSTALVSVTIIYSHNVVVLLITVYISDGAAGNAHNQITHIPTYSHILTHINENQQTANSQSLVLMLNHSTNINI